MLSASIEPLSEADRCEGASSSRMLLIKMMG
jgi:hypothetical protein